MHVKSNLMHLLLSISLAEKVQISLFYDYN